MGAMGEKIEQVLSSIIILIFNIKKKFLHKLLPTEKNHAQPKVEKKIHVPKNCPTPAQKNSGLSLNISRKQRQWRQSSMT